MGVDTDVVAGDMSVGGNGGVGVDRLVSSSISACVIFIVSAAAVAASRYRRRRSRRICRSSRCSDNFHERNQSTQGEKGGEETTKDDPVDGTEGVDEIELEEEFASSVGVAEPVRFADGFSVAPPADSLLPFTLFRRTTPRLRSNCRSGMLTRSRSNISINSSARYRASSASPPFEEALAMYRKVVDAMPSECGSLLRFRFEFVIERISSCNMAAVW